MEALDPQEAVAVIPQIEIAGDGYGVALPGLLRAVPVVAAPSPAPAVADLGLVILGAGSVLAVAVLAGSVLAIPLLAGAVLAVAVLSRAILAIPVLSRPVLAIAVLSGAVLVAAIIAVSVGAAAVGLLFLARFLGRRILARFGSVVLLGVGRLVLGSDLFTLLVLLVLGILGGLRLNGGGAVPGCIGCGLADAIGVDAG